MRFPKILIISEFGFNSNSGGGLLFKNLFNRYPKDKIGLIHEDKNFDDKNFGLCICLKSRNKFFNFFLKLSPNNFKNFLKSIFFFFKKKNNDSFETKISHKESIQKFNPDIIYTIFGNKELMFYIKNVHIYFGYTLIIHIMDNWMSETSYEEKAKKDLLKYFLKSARTRIAINKKMAETYTSKFSKKFEVIHNSLDRRKVKKVNNFNKKKILTYIGSVYENAQLNSLIKISDAVVSLHNQNTDLQFKIYLPRHQLDLIKPKFPNHNSIKLEVNEFNDNEYFTLISEANLLILASNFDRKSINYYKYSWPAKMPSYLMSNVPIFILGPLEIFFIEEAKRKNWGFVCEKNDIKNIQDSITKILYNEKIKKKIIENAIFESKKFELDYMKTRFYKILKNSINN